MGMKTCKTCSIEKPLDAFQFRKDSGGYRPVCNECRAESERKRRIEHGEEIRAKDKERWHSDRNGRRTRSLERGREAYYAMKANQELHEAEKKRNRERAKRFADKWRALVALRRKRLVCATPSWLTADEKWMMKEAKLLAKKRTEATKIQWSVDHIIPLAGKEVCGLHVPWNLQVIPAEQNKSKGNRLTNEQ
jgi:hypothetical protein